MAEADRKGTSAVKSFIVGTAVAVGILALVSLGLRGIPGAAGPPTCDKIAPQIVRLSEDKMLSILKISNVMTVSSVENEVRCQGDARWSNDQQRPVAFHWERDADGDAFIGYRMQ